MVMPLNSDPERPLDDPKKIWNNIGKPKLLGTANLPSTPSRRVSVMFRSSSPG